MEPTAFLFAGQGADLLHALRAFADHSSRTHDLLERARRFSGHDQDLLERGGRALRSTRVSQPALVALCLAVCEELRVRGIPIECAAGHSLGELSAWSALGAISVEDAIDLAGERGRLMEREAERNPGAMLALVDANESSVDAALRLGRSLGTLVVSARNATDEWVLSGDETAIMAVASRFRSVRIPTPGAWHSPSMLAAVDELTRIFRAVPRSPMAGCFVANRTGEIVKDEAEGPTLLAEQLVHPVDWLGVLRTIRLRGVRRFVTVGPGRVLRGFVRKTFGSEALVMTTETPEELEATIGRLKP